HPFHRLRGQTFEVLKVRRLSGQESLSLRDPERGTFAMLRNWTDWAPPGASPSPGCESLLIDAFGLVQLAELVACLSTTTTDNHMPGPVDGSDPPTGPLLEQAFTPKDNVPSHPVW